MKTKEGNLIFTNADRVRIINFKRNFADRVPHRLREMVEDTFGGSFIGHWTGYVMVF